MPVRGLCLFLVGPWVGLLCVIVAFPLVILFFGTYRIVVERRLNRIMILYANLPEPSLLACTKLGRI